MLLLWPKEWNKLEALPFLLDRSHFTYSGQHIDSRDVIYPANCASRVLLCLASVSLFNLSFIFGWLNFACGLFAKELGCLMKIFTIQWISEEILKKEKILVESNWNDFSSTRRKTEKSWRGRKKIVTGLSKWKWRKETETRNARAGGILNILVLPQYSVCSRLHWGLVSGELETSAWLIRRVMILPHLYTPEWRRNLLGIWTIQSVDNQTRSFKLKNHFTLCCVDRVYLISHLEFSLQEKQNSQLDRF